MTEEISSEPVASAEVLPLKGVDPRPAKVMGGVAAILLIITLTAFAVLGFNESATPVVLPSGVFAFFFSFMALLLFIVGRQDANRPGALTIGDDGLLVARGASHTFYPYDRIHSVTTTDLSAQSANRRLMTLVLKGGGDRALCWSEPRKLADFLDIAARIESARQRYLQRPPVTASESLARNGRPVAAWRADLDTAGGGFRIAERAPEALAEVLASPSAA